MKMLSSIWIYRYDVLEGEFVGDIEIVAEVKEMGEIAQE